MGRNHEAVKVWGNVSRLDPGDSEVSYFLALALGATGDSVARAEELRRYIERDPDGRWAPRALALLGPGP